MILVFFNHFVKIKGKTFGSYNYSLYICTVKQQRHGVFHVIYKNKNMKKHWIFRKKEYTMIQRGYGQYTLNGIYCTNSFIWDYVTDDENIKYRGTARRYAELFVNNNK